MKENLPDQRIQAAAPCRARLSDIPYVPTDEAGYTGWAQGRVHPENRRLAMGERMARNLVMESLLRAVAAAQPPVGLLPHSDNGSQYCSLEYQKLLERLGIKASNKLLSIRIVSENLPTLDPPADDVLRRTRYVDAFSS